MKMEKVIVNDADITQTTELRSTSFRRHYLKFMTSNTLQINSTYLNICKVFVEKNEK
jgi:hypothetical protein